MKVKAALKKMCDACFFVRRRGRLYVYCKKNGKVNIKSIKSLIHSTYN